MIRLRFAALLIGLLALTGGIVGQANGQKKEDAKKEETKKDDVKKDDTKKDAKKDDPMPKAKGQLPQNWGKIGLTEDQKQKVYVIQNKYNEEIDKLEAQIKSLKEKMSKERLEVLSADQKKKLKEITDSKAGG